MNERFKIKRKIRQTLRTVLRMNCQFCVPQNCDKRCAELLMQAKYAQLSLDLDRQAVPQGLPKIKPVDAKPEK